MLSSTVLRFLICLACLSLALVASAQNGFTYEPTGFAVFQFKAESLKDTHGPELFEANTVVHVQTFAFLGGGIIDSDLSTTDSDGVTEIRVKSGPRPKAAEPLLELHYYPATDADRMSLPWKPSLIVAMTAN